MKSIVHLLRTASFTVSSLTFFLASAALAAQEPEDWLCRVMSVQGTVQAQKAGETRWTPVHLDDVFVAGDTIRTLERSRAALLLRNDSITRMDENTTVTLVALEQERRSVLDLIQGGGFFFNRAPSKMRIITPFVNAAVEGTEFFLGVDRSRTLLSVFEGKVSASNDAGAMLVQRNQSVVAQAGRAPVIATTVRPRDAVQWTLYFPPIADYRLERTLGVDGGRRQALRESMELYRKGDLTGAFASLDRVPAGEADAEFHVYRASLLLAVGHVEEAASDLRHALELDPGSSDAHAYQAIMAVTRNDRENGLKVAQRAVEVDPTSSTALIALSYAQQARFDLKSAHASLKKAVEVQPTDALAWARLAELELSHGRLNEALEAAREAVRLDPELAHAQTVLGFAYLTQIRIGDSKAAFQKAIRLAPADPMPRLGLGLATIREGDLKAGRREIEIAAILDPERSLIRSYLGKAYFEEKRDKQAAEQLSSAKELDPLDPTPWYYDAIRKQTVNRPVEGLEDLEKAMELNDNRAVFRSRLLLDDDLAARQVSLGRIYTDLGFGQLALAEGWRAVNADPTNYSAHRLLSDTYSTLPRHDIGRVSELFQAQMLQPLNINPVQPRLGDSELTREIGQRISDPGLNEYTSLFNRNGPALVVSGAAGENGLLSEEVLQSAIWNRVSYSLGQFHQQSDGFRHNDDLQEDSYNLFTQVSLTPTTSIQAEYRHLDLERGDTYLLFDKDFFFRTYRNDRETDFVRFGFHQQFSNSSDLLGSFNYANRDNRESISSFDWQYGIEAYGFEGQYLYHSEWINLISGAGYFNSDYEIIFNGDGNGASRYTIPHSNLYLYSMINYPERFSWTLGASADFYKDPDLDLDLHQWNPKFGVIWTPFDGTTIRAAAFRTLKRTLINDQTLEPTQVAGFEQFFDDANGTRAWRYGLGIDQKITSHLSMGAEVSMRDLDTRGQVLLTGENVGAELEEYLCRAYLYWTPHPWVALGPEYQFERFLNPETLMLNNVLDLNTHRFTLNLGVFHPSGFFCKLGPAVVLQDGRFPSFELGADGLPVIVGTSDHSNFFVLDASVGYRLPRRLGLISVEARNLLDKSFRFQDSDPYNPRYIPDRVVMVKFTLSF